MVAEEQHNGKNEQDSTSLGQILYEEELGSYLSGFIDPDTPTAPKNMDEVIERMTAIWEEKGFLQPHDLTTEMLDSCLPDCQQRVRTLVREMLECQSSPDPLTGFARKEATPLLTGLAHLYGVQTDQPVTMIEGDFGNMGGTNEHFRKLLAAERGVDVADVDIEDSFPYTDKAARTVAGLAAKAFKDHMAANGLAGNNFAAVRSGGDEIRFIAVGVDGKTAERIIEEKVNPAVEDFTARAGLHDHPHTKARSDRYRDGFGAAFAAMRLDDTVDPATIIKTADVHIGAHKMSLGYLRKGEVFEPHARETQLKQIYKHNPGLLPDGQPPEQAAAADMAMLAEQAAIKGQYFSQLKAASGTTYENANQISLERTPELSPYGLNQAQAKAVLGAVSTVIEEEYKDYSSPFSDTGADLSFDDGTKKGYLFQTPEARREQLLIHELKNADIQISTGEQKFLKMALEGLSPKDPPTGANMPKEMPEIASIFAHDTQKLAVAMTKRMQAGDENIIKAFDDAGMQPDDLRAHALCVSFHNLAGINELHGHHLADTVLDHMANKIIGSALEEQGLDKDDYVLSHEGGARFMAVIKPMTYSANAPVTDDQSTIGSAKVIDERTMASIEQAITENTARLNNTPVKAFFSAHAENEGEQQETTFSTTPDPKRPYSTGLDVSTARRALVTTDMEGNKLSGGHNLHLVRQDAEAEVDRVRNEKKSVFESTNKVTNGVSRDGQRTRRPDQKPG